MKAVRGVTDFQNLRKTIFKSAKAITYVEFSKIIIFLRSNGFSFVNADNVTMS
jgi:hypothetical protein